MADGNGTTEVAQLSRPDHTHTLLLGQDHVLDCVIDAEFWGKDHAREVALRLMRIADISLRMALCRGEDDSDAPGTLALAVEGANVILQLAIGVSEAAEREVSNG